MDIVACLTEQKIIGTDAGIVELYSRIIMGKERKQGKSWFATRKARMCLALAVVNLFLIVGTIVSAIEAQSGETSQTKDSSIPPHLKLYPIETGVPTDLKEALIKLYFYLQAQGFGSNSTTCHFAWKVNTTQGNSTDLFVCR